MKISEFRQKLIDAEFYGANIISEKAVAYFHANGNIIKLRELGFQIREEYPYKGAEDPNAFIVPMNKHNIELLELTGWNVISKYSRAQAIEDGVLVDVTETAKEVGFRFPVAVTSEVWADINNIPQKYQGIQDVEGRLYDVLYMLMFNIRKSSNTDTIRYLIIMHIGRAIYYDLKAVCGPGDDAEPVITIMKPNQD